MARRTGTLGWLAAAIALVLVLPGCLSAEESAGLAQCGVAAPAREARDRARELADFVAEAHAGSYPAAVALARSTAEITAVLESQVAAVEPARAAFFDSWERFDGAVRRSPLPRDPALRQVLTAYRHSVQELDGLLGCRPESAEAMIPCPAIPTAHLLAVLGAQMDDYIEGRGYGERYPDAAAAAEGLAGSSRHLHEVLHDLEIAIPGVQGSFTTLAASLEGSALTDTDEPEDLAVKSRVAALETALASLGASVGSCHGTVPAAASEGHDHR